MSLLFTAINIDGCEVRGYTAWSFMDNFEWMRGYSEHFGLHYVNFSDPNRVRTPKASAAYYTSIIEANGFLKPGSSLPVVAPDSSQSNQPKIINLRKNNPTSNSVTVCSFNLTNSFISLLLFFLMKSCSLC